MMDYRMRRAFTMIEVVMVMIVLAILASFAIPRMERDLKQEAADNVLSAIRYTQHLAQMDDKHKFDNPKWQQRFWRIYFGTCDDGKFYVIGSDDNMESANNGRVDFNESALDPANGKHIWAHDGGSCGGGHQLNELSPNIFLGKKYGVTNIAESGGCGNSYLGFDHLGRPYSSEFTDSNESDNKGYMTSQCKLVFTLSDGSSFQINVEPETGYAYINNQSGS
ncbi:pilus assembly FimT family protein [Nitratifractor sp.]